MPATAVPDSHLRSKGVTGAQLTTWALQFQGTPYQWGGTTPKGFDCSGFVQYVYRHFNIELPRTTYEQIKVGTQVSYDQIQIGDILFFDNGDHEGIALGGGRFLHAPHTGDVVKISPLAGHYHDNFTAARRIVKVAGATTAPQGTQTGTTTTSTKFVVKRGPWATDLLRQLGVPTSKNNLTTIIAWIIAEGTSAVWNPLATTQDMDGATNFNGTGVKNYKNEQDGYDATIKTLRNGDYDIILADLRASETPDVVIHDIANSKWGTKLADLQGGLATVKKDYAAASAVLVTGNQNQSGTADTEGLPNPIDAISNPLNAITDILGRIFSIRGLEVLGGILLLGGAGIVLYLDTKK